MKENKVKFMDLTWPLRFSTIGGLIVFGVYMIFFVLELLAGIMGV